MANNSLFSENVWFLDFEGNQAGEIFLAGVLHSGQFKQVVLDQRLNGLASHHSMELKTPIEFMNEIIGELRKVDGVIAAYTNVEKDTIAKIFESVGGEAPAYNYCNLHAAAKKWIKKYKKQAFADLPPLKKTAKQYEAKRHPYSLASVMRLLGQSAPTDYAIGKTTKRINAVVDGLRAKGGIYQNLTTTKKRQATQLLKHNKFDVESLPPLLDEIASTDLALFSKSGWTPSEGLSVSSENMELVLRYEIPGSSEDDEIGDGLSKIREKSPNAYRRWTESEEARLVKLFQEGWGVEEISKALGRQPGGVVSRLMQFNLIEADQGSALS